MIGNFLNQQHFFYRLNQLQIKTFLLLFGLIETNFFLIFLRIISSIESFIYLPAKVILVLKLFFLLIKENSMDLLVNNDHPLSLDQT